MRRIDRSGGGQVSRLYMVELALKNLRAKKVRAMVTIGGVAVGVGAIVFLVSLGYGLERMVISKVARLDELKMLDVGLGEVSSLKMNDEFIKKISEIGDVDEVIPVVGMVSKVRFRNSVSDIMAFGVDQRYIKAVGVKMISGTEFKDKDIGYKIGEGTVAGVSQEMIKVNVGDRVIEGIYRLNTVGGEKLSVFEKCDSSSENLGYMMRVEGGVVGEKVWGESYHLGSNSQKYVEDVVSGKELSPWVRLKTSLWQVDDSDTAIPILDDSGAQRWVIGCVRDNGLKEEDGEELTSFKTLNEYLVGVGGGSVLGESTSSASPSAMAAASASDSAVAKLFDVVVATDSAGVEWVELKKTGESAKPKEDLVFNDLPSGEAYVSSGLVKMFGMDKQSILGQKFGVSYIIPDGLIPGSSGRTQSQETDYTVKAVVDDDASNYYYFQIGDAKKLGVKNYSQIKVLTKDQGKVLGVRKSIESSGFRTMSTLDTVAQIENLFGTLRLLLGFLGTIALAVASLGMFNTMTVSLLERTREVGVMKAMGMQIAEVRELFLAESMIMGVGGGVMGILLGYLGGRLLSLILSSVSMFKGQGLIDISYIPLFFVTFILTISFVVGIVTGWYPSKRATKISALNALRYE
ncbi:ABC transporter permease [Candidatus Shapirobacteria bacterium]|nr:ABC transporter permease [Candidatus Shapirobacteria bacterium]